MRAPGQRGHEPVLYGLAFLSGFAALTYEVSWAKLLSLTFGSTTLATSAVVAAFMGGMGLGAWRLHRLQGRVSSPLRLYALLELGIALSAAALTRAFWPLPELFARVATQIPAGWPMDLFRVGIVFALLVVPAALMGATYPALCLAMIRSREGVERHLGVIYGINTVGAAVGALVTGVFLIAAFGLHATVTVGNAINLTVAAAALALSVRTSAAAAPAAPAAPAEPLPSLLPLWVTGLVLFGSGFTTLAYEIVWLRALRYLVGNSTFALSVVLVVFLLGLGIGSMLFGPVVRRLRPERALALTQVGIAVLALGAIAVEYGGLATPALAGTVSAFSELLLDRPWWQRLLIHGGFAAAMMLPATLPMGLSFPLATRLLLGDTGRLGARVGLAYLLANLGSILGSVLAALWILPVFGTVGGTRLLAVANLALALLVTAKLPLALRPRTATLAGAATAVVLGGALLPARLPFVGANLAHLRGELVMEEEGDLATVQVREEPHQRAHRGMLIDGTIIGVSRGWYYPIYSKQVVLAHLPLVLDPSLRHVLNVGLGSGSTLAQLATHPTLETLDVVEISGAVVRGAAFFDESEALGDPRVTVAVEDVLHFLLKTPRSYDLIVSDGKQNDHFSGTSKVLSVEFYEHARRRLSPDGLFIQAIPLGTLPEDFDTILRSLVSVFPEVEIFMDPPLTVVMVASQRPIAGRARMDEAQLRSLPASRELAALAIQGVDALLATWVASRQQLLAVLPPGPVNDWDRLPLEFSAYRAPSAARAGAAAANLERLLAAHAAGPSPAAAAFAPQESAVVRARHEAWQACLDYLNGRPARAVERLELALRESPDDPWIEMVLLNFRKRL